jgi:formamidopyrimidine-DNA glycosylase
MRESLPSACYHFPVPELPDLEVYREALAARILGRALLRVRIGSPALLRSVDPPVAAAEGRSVRGLRRVGKRLAIGLDGGIHLVIHLMIAGRLRWRARGAALARRGGLAAFDFENGTLLLVEAGTKRRATLYVVAGEAELAQHDPGGLEVERSDLATFAARIRAENHTLKRALTDPRILAGIGNAYSDEVLHAARLSPVRQTRQLSEAELERLFAALRETLSRWTERLRREVGNGFPEQVTAFRPEMAVHGRFGKPCPACGAPVQRVVHAENETNYCASCQTGGRLLADRALSRLLHEDWPRTLEELEARRSARG